MFTFFYAYGAISFILHIIVLIVVISLSVANKAAKAVVLRESMTEQPVTSVRSGTIDFYDSKANVKSHRKQTRRELHESMKGRRKKE